MIRLVALIFIYKYLFAHIFFLEIPLCSTASTHYYAFSFSILNHFSFAGGTTVSLLDFHVSCRQVCCTFCINDGFLFTTSFLLNDFLLWMSEACLYCDFKSEVGIKIFCCVASGERYFLYNVSIHFRKILRAGQAHSVSCW